MKKEKKDPTKLEKWNDGSFVFNILLETQQYAPAKTNEQLYQTN